MANKRQSTDNQQFNHPADLLKGFSNYSSPLTYKNNVIECSQNQDDEEPDSILQSSENCLCSKKTTQSKGSNSSYFAQRPEEDGDDEDEDDNEDDEDEDEVEEDLSNKKRSPNTSFQSASRYGIDSLIAGKKHTQQTAIREQMTSKFYSKNK